MTDRISTEDLRKLLAKSEAGYTYAGIDLENIAPDLAAEVIRLREVMRKAAHVLKVKQPDKLDDARSMLIEALNKDTDNGTS